MADWICDQSGECCLDAGAVSMTPAEWALMSARRPDVAVIVLGTLEGDRIEITSPTGGRACPFYLDHACAVYEVRPSVCRAFGCFRRRPTDPYRGIVGTLARLDESAGIRRVARAMTQDADAWRRTAQGGPIHDSTD